ncbi:type IV toxin-antitoxin system AbiEi family antitoxin domain-containing protein [Kribbella sp. NPDC051587]|uniref:type IV toxin-antitoxin system AbiEi family antitoxin domain-containing protein n=1 Tax=Kribbella sp. NPDC051587 TaxID=3364119 RepID=UPI003799668A
MNVKLRVIAEQQGGVFSRRQALASGYTPRQVRDLLGNGRWVRIRHGQYAERPDETEMPDWERIRLRHLRAIRAAMNSLRPGSVAVSHQSALVVHGLPLWGLDLELVHVTRLDGQAGGLTAGVRHHLGVLIPADLAVIDGLLVTTVPRAVVETASIVPFESGVVVADAALRRGAFTAGDLERLQGAIEFWPGGPAARAVLRFADPLSESVGESRVRVLMHQHGLPAPKLQVEFYDAEGLIGRPDFYFDAEDSVVEFDGLLKYSSGEPEVLIREKRREDRLRALGLHVVRTVWSDLSRPDQLAATIRRSLNRARPAA